MRARNYLLAGFVLLLTIWPGTAHSFGQGIVTGTISGIVQDPSSAVLQGATVIAIENATNSSFRAVTGANGTFQLPGLPVGTYTVSVEASGFTPLKIENVTVTTGTNSPLGVLTMKVGATAEAVTVQAATALLQTDTVQITQTFDTQKTADLPIGNGFDIVALLTPGVAPSGGNEFTNSNGAEFSTNGIRDRDNNFQLDGQANNDTNIGGPNVFFGNADAIAEVQVITQDSAEYGRNSGAVVNYVTKSGSNELHGTGYEFYNGSWADSLANQDKNPLFGYCPAGVSPSTGCIQPTIPRYVDNRWGGTLGGPILKDKLWYFGSGNFEHTRTGAAPSSSAPLITPTPNGIAELQAAFPNNPAVGALAAIGPATIKTGSLTFGTPTTVDVLGYPIEFATARRTVSSPFNDDEAMGRIDYQLTAKDRIFGRYIYQKSFTYDYNYFVPSEAVTGSFVNVGGPSHYVGADWTHTFNDHLLNQARYSYSHTSITFGGGGFPDCTTGNILSGCSIRANFGDGKTLDIGEFNADWPQGRTIQSSQIQDNATWQAGRHTVKFGGEFNHFPETDYGIPNLNGTLNFNTFADYIQSNPLLTQYAEGPSTYPLTYNAGALYIQDDMKAKPNLTLSLGVRYELQSQPINGLHDLTVARESSPSTALWDTSLPLSLRTVQSLPIVKHNFGPVVGFAWQPRPGSRGETIVRGGFHIGYDATFNNPFSNIAQSTPTVNSANLSSCDSCVPADGMASSLRTIIDPQVPLGGNPGLRAQTNTDPKLHNSYTEQWTLGIQHAITPHVVGEARYVGNHGVGLFEFRNGNPALGPLISAGFANVIPAGLTPCTTPNSPGATYGYVDCNRTNLVTLGNTGFSNYNGLQTRLSIEHWHGVTAGVSYTWSKDIDNISEIYATGVGGNTTNFSQSPFDLNIAERGVSGLDYPQLTSVYMIFQVPNFRQNTLTGKLLGGWQINPVYRFASGQPYTVIENAANDNLLCDPTQTSGSTTCRPILSNSHAPFATVGQCTDATISGCGLVNYYTGVPVPYGSTHWIRNDDVTAAYFGTPFAGGGRNQQRGDTINNANLAVLKDFRIAERVTFEARGTAYNVMNRQYRGTPGVDIDYGSFADVGGSFGNTYYNTDGEGQTNSVFSGIDRRRIELGGKIRF